MRQGIVVTCFLGVFVAVAMLFTGGKSLFAVPDIPAVAVAATTAVAEATRDAAPPRQPIERSDAPSAAARDTFGVLQWLSTGFRHLDLGSGDANAQPGFTIAAGRPHGSGESTISFSARPSLSAADTGESLAAIVQPYA